MSAAANFTRQQLLHAANEMLDALSEVRKAGEAAVASSDHNESVEMLLQRVKEAGEEEHAVYLRSVRDLEVLRAGGVSAGLIQAGETEMHQALWTWAGAVREVYNMRDKIKTAFELRAQPSLPEEVEAVPPTPNVEAHTEDESDVDMAEATVSRDMGKARARTPSVERVLVLNSGSEDDESRLLAYPKDPTAASFWRRAARAGHRVPVGAGDVFGDASAPAIPGGSDELVGHWPCGRCAKRGAACQSFDKAGATSCGAFKVRKAKSAVEDKIRAAVQAEDHRLLDVVESATRSLASIAGSLVDHTTILFRINATLTEQQRTSLRMARSVSALRKLLGARVGASASGAAAAGAPSEGVGGS
ncbi:hypothetical protein BKA62DRAFT_772526 [Auriculariales sp. MPI-PUGE-AT-0066]|nr:hypothetical protein BKA62DRAFT_772526 [Auriculariales sp. MPI-PUGE-AT-0066]